jgi:SecD/SecF fusion protein
MLRRILWMSVAVVIAALWAISSSLPIKATPLDSYILSQPSPQPQAVSALVERARQSVQQGQSSAFYPALKQIVQSENIDLQSYFPQLNARDVKSLNKRNDLILTELNKRSQSKFRFGLDLAGGASFTFKVDLSKLEDDFLRTQALEKAKEILTERVDGFGVAEPLVRIVGSDAIEVQLPGLSLKENPQIARTLQAPALLHFALVHRTATPENTPEAPLGYIAMTESDEDARTGAPITRSYYVKRLPEMTGSAISQAFAAPTETGSYRVALRFTPEGARRFADLTQAIADENNATNTVGLLAIILDGQLYSAPSVREAIVGGSAEISGSFTQREAMELANVLNNPLEVGLKLDSMTEVGPSLADQARDASLLACAIGCLVVILFMVGYYGWLGVVSVIGIAFTLVLILGTMAGLGATFSLPGIAALVLTVGMAVDSNILIFERMREELKLGRPLSSAVEAGHARAFSTIFDANLTTLITAGILIWLGTGPVKGFGVILAIGIVATLFSVLVLCRALIEGLTHGGLFKKALPFDLFQIRKVDFMAAAPFAFALSWAIVAFGVWSFVSHGDKVWGIDFKGGQELLISFEEKLSPQQISSSTSAFGEVNAIYQSVVGQQTESLRLQTELDKGNEVFAALQSAYPQAGLSLISTTTIGASVGREVQTGALWAITAALVAMLLYVAFRFEVGYGVGAIVATLHDLLMTVGLFVLLGGQFSGPMIAALLLVIGYSINDTIVVFDRIREELKLNPHLKLREVINLSINITLSRTILTSFTTALATTALYIYGVGVVSDYALVFLLGIITGTYSSIFIAAPIFYWWHRGDRRHVEAKADPVATSYSSTTEAR